MKQCIFFKLREIYFYDKEISKIFLKLSTGSYYVQLTFGGSTPIEMSKRGGLVFSSGYQFNYALPWNASQLQPLIVSSRQSRNLELQDIYSSLEHLLERYNM